MSVPSNPKLRQVAGIVDKVGNFGAWPPTAAFRDAFKAQGILFNLTDGSPAELALQIAGARSHGMWVGVWHPVAPQGDDGAGRAKWIHEKITVIDTELKKLADGGGEWARWAVGKVDIVWLNLEGYTLTQWREFMWGRISAGPPTVEVRGWRGKGGVRGSSGGYRWGIATGVVDEPFKDGTVKPHGDLMDARVMLGVEAFYGPTSEWPDMTPADHPQAILDRITGQRNGGVKVPSEAWPIEQVVGCYDAALGKVVSPAEPLLIRGGLLFTLERADQAGII